MRPAGRQTSFDQDDFPTLPHFRSWVDFQLAKVLYDLRVKYKIQIVKCFQVKNK